MTKTILKEIGEGFLYLDVDGTDNEYLEDHKVAIRNRPPFVGWCDTSYIANYKGTNFYQWFGRRSDGAFHHYGKIMMLEQR